MLTTKQHNQERARSLRAWAAYQVSRGEYPGVSLAKAAQCDAVIQALELEEQHGEPYCVCHLRPMREMTQTAGRRPR